MVSSLCKQKPNSSDWVLRGLFMMKNHFTPSRLLGVEFQKVILIIFQPGGVSSHRAKNTHRVFENNNMMDWPSSSPDLNVDETSFSYNDSETEKQSTTEPIL